MRQVNALTQALKIGEWFNGRTAVSKTVNEGSIPSSPAI